MRDLIALLVDHGIMIVFAATLAARIGLPVPASPLLVIAGGLAAAGQLSGVAALLVSVTANIIGDGIWFQAGRWHGRRVLRLLCRISLSPDSCVRRSETLITRWGGSSLIAAKFLPGISVVAAPMSGALGLSLRGVVVFESIAAPLWTAAFLGLGMVFSDQIQQVLDAMAGTGAVASTLLVAVLVALLAGRYWRRRSLLHDLAMARITVDDLNELMRDGESPLIIDVRSGAAMDLDERRIPGAISITLEQISSRASELPRERQIVVYCNCPNEVSAARAARILSAEGLQQVRPLAGGLEAWIAAGRPTVPALV